MVILDGGGMRAGPMEAARASRARLFGRDAAVPGDGWGGTIRARWREQQLCRYKTMCLMCTLDESGEKNISRKSGDTERETSGARSNVKGPDQDVEL
jgi:hypothetical protein